MAMRARIITKPPIVHIYEGPLIVDDGRDPTVVVDDEETGTRITLRRSQIASYTVASDR